MHLKLGLLNSGGGATIMILINLKSPLFENDHTLTFEECNLLFTEHKSVDISMFIFFISDLMKFQTQQK